jgi:pyrroline-5-carboxylate reductase
MIEKTVGFVGAGIMAEALVRDMLRTGMVRSRDVYASDPSQERRSVFEQQVHAHVLTDNAELMRRVEIVVLSVKPQVLPAVVEEIAPCVTPNHLFISIAPGITLQWMSKHLGTERIVRVMPNTPILVGAGAAAFCCGKDVEKTEVAFVERAMAVDGICVQVREELMDAVTGLSGSGPAFVYMVIEAMSDAGVKMGLGREVAVRLAAQTVLGAAKMVLQTGKHPGQLRDMVTTPGGTTIEGIHALEKAGLRGAIMDAVEAAALKSRLLGQNVG